MKDQYHVNLLYSGTELGAGFIVNSRYVLTAAHCLRWLPPDTLGVQIQLASGARIDGTVVEQHPRKDLALIEIGQSEEFIPRPPCAEKSRPDDRWASGYRPSQSDPEISGTVLACDMDYQCVGGDTIKALQLKTRTDIGDYSGYSGSPIEQRNDDLNPYLTAILIEQYPDRQHPERSSNVLFATDLGTALTAFSQFDVKHLHGVLAPELDDASAIENTPNQEERSEATRAIDDSRVFMAEVDAWEAGGLIDQQTASQLRLRIIERTLDRGLS
ncbi:S1 family peptidase [Glycomyces sp. MUSA5-2]|uniref:S1 family peptidase n=1 Tax=Glycomyces sp. MUSA5-2 TaxID=2053002 RepID=UPI00300BF203